jgi:hypothetical protein
MGMNPLGNAGSGVEAFMDRASSLIYPGSRTLAGWWRKLVPYQPAGIWLGYGFLHRIEASVHVLNAQPLEPLSHLLLQALDIEHTPGAHNNSVVHMSALTERLRLPLAILQRMLSDMHRKGLLEPSSTGGWQITQAGQGTLVSRHLPQRAIERRIFSFLERLDSAGQRSAEPHFVPITESAGVPWPVDVSYRFDVEVLKRCWAQSAEWKKAHAFPAQVESLADIDENEPWHRVIIDRPERIMLVLILTSRQSVSELLGFSVKVDGWTLNDQAPATRLAATARNIWPELVEQVPIGVWETAWRGWCRERQLPNNEVELCTVAHHPPRLEVHAPPRLVQRLQAAKSDLFKGEAWLLVGDGYMRTAAQLVIRPS